MKKLVKLSTILLLLVLAFVPINQAKAITVEEIKDRGEIVMGTSADFPPFEWVVLEDGKEKEVGVDIELAQKIAEKLGVQLKVVNTSFDSLVQSVKTGKVDMVLAGMAYTEERAKEVAFSEVYYSNANQFVTSKEIADHFQSFEDIEKHRVGVQKGSIQEGLAKEFIPKAELTMMSDNPDLIQAILVNRLDLALFDSLVAQQFVAQHPDKLTILSDLEIENQDQGISVVTAKESQDLLAVINEVLKEQMAEGTIDQWVDHYIQLNAQGSN
ncbi:transporter substrate-binding domain-containing protein [Hutsoniella sourekii]